MLFVTMCLTIQFLRLGHQHVWSFPCNIVSFCWSDASYHTLVQAQPPRALVATKDGRIWSIPLLQSRPGVITRTGSSSSLKRSSSKVTIEIDDSDDEVEEVEEIELWNDEDGLLDSAKTLDMVAPAAKRQRISFSRPSTPSPSMSNQSGHLIQVNTSQHYVGSEVGHAKKKEQLIQMTIVG